MTGAGFRRFRLRLAGVPILSLLLCKWTVFYGSTVIDHAMTYAAAERRARAFIGEDIKKWNSVQVTR